MDYFKINLLIVGAFLLISLIVGLWAGRNVTTIRDYALANKAYGTGPLVMTYVATVIGGGWVFRRPEDMFKNGIGSVLVLIIYAIGMFMRAKYISPKMLPFRKCLSLGDMIGEMYGLQSRVLAGILSLIFSTIITSMNVCFLSIVFEKFLGLNGTFGIILGTIITTLYSVRGGIRSVTATDIIQFVLLVGTLLMVVILGLNKLGGIETLISKIPSDKLEFFGKKNIYSNLSLILTQILFFSAMIDPAQLDRMLMAKSTSHMSKMLYVSGVAIIIIVSIIAIITFSSLILYPDVDASIIMWHMINRLVPEWAQGFAIVGIISILFSTTDSYMHSGGIAFTHDIMKPLSDKYSFKIDELKWTKLSAIIIAALSIWFAIWGKYIFKIEYLVRVNVSVLAAPMMFGIFGIKPEEKAFWISSIAASIALIVCMMANSTYYPLVSGFSILISTCVSAIVYMAVHIDINKGIFIITNHGFNSPDRPKYEPKEKEILNQIVDIIYYPFRFAKRCRINVATYGTPPYALFGALYLILLVLPYFIGQEPHSQYYDFILALKFIGIIICALLMTESIWPSILRPYLPAFWYMALAYCLPFLSTILLIITAGDTWYLVNVAVSIIFLMILADWKSILSISVIGAVAAVLFLKYGIGNTIGMESYNVSFHIKYLLGSQVLFATIIGLMLVRRKQSKVDNLRDRKTMLEGKYRSLKDQFLAALSVEDKITQGLGMREINMIERITNLESLCKDFMKKVPDEKEFVDRYKQASQTLKYLANLSEQAKEYTKLKVDTISMDLFLSSLDEAASLYSEDYSVVVRTEITAFECDTVALSSVITDALEKIHTLNVNDDHVEIDIANTEILYTLPSLPNYKKRLKALQFTISTAPTLGKDFFPKSYSEELRNPKDIIPVKENNVDAIICQRIMAAHFGLSKTINDENGHTIIFVVPVHLRHIRPLPLDLEIPKEVIITWPGAIDLENKLKKEITAKAPKVSPEKIEKAIDLIKKYHYHQNRHSGEPYYLHPVQVAMIELEFSQEEDAILGALLHDTLEDTALHIMDIKTMFGDNVAGIVLGVSKIDHASISKFKSNAEHLSTLDKENTITLTIKIADRLHNMRTIYGHKSLDKQKAIAQETLNFFVPLAKNLGLMEACEELKKLSEVVLKKD